MLSPTVYCVQQLGTQTMAHVATKSRLDPKKLEINLEKAATMTKNTISNVWWHIIQTSGLEYDGPASHPNTTPGKKPRRYLSRPWPLTSDE